MIKDVLPDFDYWVDEFAWVPVSFVPEIYFTAARHGEESVYATRPTEWRFETHRQRSGVQ